MACNCNRAKWPGVHSAVVCHLVRSGNHHAPAAAATVDRWPPKEYNTIKMSETFQLIQELVRKGEVQISAHGYDELAADAILVNDILASVQDGVVVEKEMSTRHQTKLVHEGEFVAEVEVDVIESSEGWGPYLSLEEARKLDDVREALRWGDLTAANKLARVYRIMRVPA